MFFRKYALRIVAFFVGILLVLSVAVPTNPQRALRHTRSR